MRRRSKFLFLICMSVLIAMLPLAALAAESDPTAAQVIERLNKLESRVNDLEGQVASLKQEKQVIETKLQRQEHKNVALRSKIEDPMPANQAQLTNDTDQPRRPPLISSYGVRAGYQGFPFGQREGGYFYGIFLDHAVANEADGVPLGDLDFEVGANVAFSGTDQVLVHSTVVGAPQEVGLRQRMFSFWPDLKYKLNVLNRYGLSPYVTGGPGIWADVIETPPLVGGLQFPTKELAARKLPVIAGADLYEGAQGGAGAEMSFSRFDIPILNRMKIGFDYRYSAWTAGQRFNTFSLLFSYHG
jgi:hypothetical protein